MIFVLGSTRRRLRSTVPDHLREARIHLVHGDHEAALAELHKALEIAPYLGEAYFQRGCVHEAKGQVDLALADFDQAIQCDPQLSLAYLHRGRIRTEKGDLEPALADFDQVMIMRPNDPECYLNRGVCLAKKGLISDAILDFQRVLKLTNHSDYAEPARHYLEQLGGENPLLAPSPAPGLNGSSHARRGRPGRAPGPGLRALRNRLVLSGRHELLWFMPGLQPSRLRSRSRRRRLLVLDRQEHLGGVPGVRHTEFDTVNCTSIRLISS